MHVIGPGTILQSLSVRRTVAALCYIYKLSCIAEPPQLIAILPDRALPAHAARTREQLRTKHKHQLRTRHAVTAPDYQRRSFPSCVVPLWNSLPPQLLPDHLSIKSLQQFKVNVFRHLQHSRWQWATDYN